MKAFEKLGVLYYLGGSVVSSAYGIARATTFNLIHLDTMLKVDVFIMKDSPYHKESLKRRKKDVLDEEQDNIEFYLVSPEDILGEGI